MRRSSRATALGGGMWLVFAPVALAQVAADPASQPNRQAAEPSRVINTGVPPPPGMGDDVCWVIATNTGVSCTVQADCSVGTCGNKDAYVSFTPPSGADLAIQITIVAMPQFPDRVGDVWWVKAPQSVADRPNPPITVAEVECTTTPHKQDWSGIGVLHVFGESILPSQGFSSVSLYAVRMCRDVSGACSDPLSISTAKYGDVVAIYGGGGQPDKIDISAIVRTFQGSGNAPSITRAELLGVGPNQIPDQRADFVDIAEDVLAFEGRNSRRVEPTACPP